MSEKLKRAYSGWHPFATHEKQEPPAQMDLEAEIERRVQERLAAAAPKKGKGKLEVVE